MYKRIDQIDDLRFDTFFTPTRSDTTRNTEYKLYVEYSKTNVSPLAVGSLTTKSAPNINKLKNLLYKDPNLLANKFDCDSYIF